MSCLLDASVAMACAYLIYQRMSEIVSPPTCLCYKQRLGHAARDVNVNVSQLPCLRSFLGWSRWRAGRIHIIRHCSPHPSQQRLPPLRDPLRFKRPGSGFAPVSDPGCNICFSSDSFQPGGPYNLGPKSPNRPCMQTPDTYSAVLYPPPAPQRPLQA